MMIAKKTIILSLSFVTIFTNAQIIPVEEFYKVYENDEMLQGDKWKDVNGVYDPFIGTWTLEWNNKFYEFKFEKITVNSGKEIDQLHIKYNIKDANDSFIEKHICESNELCSNDGKMQLGYLKPNGKYKVYYEGIGNNCNSKGFNYFWLDSSDMNKMNFEFKLDIFNDIDCGISQNNNLPSEMVTLTKQCRVGKGESHP